MMHTLLAIDSGVTEAFFLKRFDIRQMFSALRGAPKVFSHYSEYPDAELPEEEEVPRVPWKPNCTLNTSDITKVHFFPRYE